MSKFFISLGVYTLMLFGFCKWAECKARQYAPADGTMIIAFLAFFTIVLYITLVYFQRRRPKCFPLAYLASISLKLLASVGFLFYLIRQSPTEGKGLAVVFLASYLGFTVIEVYGLRKLFLK